MQRQRRFLIWLTVLALACAGLQALTGVSELALYLTPLFLLASLLLSGHYVAEERIVARWRRGRPRPRRAAEPRCRPAAAVRPLSTLLERSPLTRRGPPAVAAA